MLPLKPMKLETPRNESELLSMLAHANERTKLLAGGTDLLPNLKHGLYDTVHVISLRSIERFKTISVEDHQLTIGSLTKLREIAHHDDIKRFMPALAQASVMIASPQIQNMGTVGGNICLDTRCLYFNQTEFWRNALGYCLKKDGCLCHVTKVGKRCVAAASNDLATVLLSYDTKLSIASPDGHKTCELDNFYVNNGEKNNCLASNEVVTNITVSLRNDSYSGYFKLRHRDSIDFPLLSTAVRFSLDEHHRLKEGKLVLNALVAKPKVMDLAEFEGLAYNDDLIQTIAKAAEKRSHPQTNICDDTSWRKEMVFHSVKQACIHARRVGPR